MAPVKDWARAIAPYAVFFGIPLLVMVVLVVGAAFALGFVLRRSHAQPSVTCLRCGQWARATERACPTCGAAFGSDGHPRS